MSSIAMQGGATGTGTVTLLAPVTNTNRTINLPDSNGTVALQGGTGVGKVLQVVNATYATQASNATSTYADTGLTASITPTSATSKILVIVNQADVGKTTNDTSCRIRLLRGATVIVQMALFAGGTGTTAINVVGSVGTSFLDSPATTSSTTYKTTFMSSSNNATAFVQFGGTDSTITLMEIAA